MLDGPLACPYCLNAVERPEAARPKSAQRLPRVGVPRVRVRRLGQVAAVCLCVAGTLAAAYELAPQVIQHWDDLSKIFPAKRAAAKNVQPDVETPSPIRVSQPLEPSQLKPDPRVPEVEDQPLGTAQSQPIEQQNPAEPPAQIPEPHNPSGGTGNAPPPVEKPAVQVAPPAKVAPPVIVSFTSSAQTIDRGATATLRWEVTGDSPTVTILPAVGTVPSTGFWQVKPEATQRFTLTTTNGGESIPLTRSIEIVVVQPKRPTIVNFTADSSQLRLGQTTALRWSVLGASEVRIDPGIGLVSTTGTAVVRPLSGTAYTLTATGAGGTSTGALPISVDVPASAPASAPARYANNPPPANLAASNRTPLSSDRIDPQALELLAAVQTAMGGKRNLESIHDWQRTDRVNWEVNGGWSMETTTFAAPSGIRVESQSGSTAVIFSNGEAGWAWSSARPERSDLPSPTATSLPFRSLPTLLLSDDDPQRTVVLAGPSTLLIADNHGDRVFLKVDPSTYLPQAISWMNFDGAELEETYSNWRQGAGILWWCHMTRSRNHQEFLRADVTNFHANQGWTPQRIAFVGP
jgi:hypothetical protein